MPGLRSTGTILALVLMAANAWAVRVSPGVTTVRGIPVGTDTSLGIPLICYNDADVDMTFTIRVVKPSGVIKHWRDGYDEIPDTTWLYVDGPREVVVPARGNVKLPLRVHIPDSEAYYNQMWAAYILVTAESGAMFNTAVAPLFMLETRVLANPSVPPAGEIGTAPAAVELSTKSPGAQVWIYNNTDSTVLLDISPYVPSGDKPEIEATAGWTYDRDFRDGLKTSAQKVKIKPHGRKRLKIKATVFPKNRAEALIKISDGTRTKFIRVFWVPK